MRTSANTAESLFPSWKEEVNRRVAAHMSHKGHPATQPVAAAGHKSAAASRAAQAAARVAARYASAPSYSEMLAREAFAAAQAAEAASRAAQHAHAAAQFVLAGLEAASAANPEWDLGVMSSNASESRSDSPTNSVASGPAGLILIQEEPPMAERPVQGHDDQAAAPTATYGKLREDRPAIIEAAEIDEVEYSSPAPLLESAGNFAATDVAEPIYANLIQFPREVVATRKLRPRRIEGPLATAAPGVQLSIFEVDPGSLSVQPDLAAAEEPLAPAWMREEWAGSQLEEPPQETIVEEPEPLTPPEPMIQLASLSRRLLALVVDATLVFGAVLALIAPVVHYAKALPSLHALELITVITLLLLGAAYHSLFLAFASATPGMWYAGIALRTLEGEIPRRRQRCARLLALPLSILPLGLGLAWSLFDENNLTWHDRLSGTYLRTQ